MKVLVVTNMYPSRQNPVYGTFVKEEVESLKKKGCTIHLSAVKKEGGSALEKVWKYVALFLRTFLLLLTRKIDVVHIHYVFPTAIIAPILNRLFRKKIVLTEHGTKLFHAKGLKKRLIQSVFDSSEKLIVVSNHSKQLALDNYSIVEDKIEVINCGVDPTLFYKEDKKAAKQKLSLPDKYTLLFLGRITREKGTETLKELITLLEAKNELGNYQFVIVGNGPDKEQLKNYLHDYMDNVLFVNGVEKSKVSEWFNAADLFLFPTLKESFGLVALESLLCGTPVIATNVGGVPETVINNETGFLVEPNDAEAFYQKITELATNEVLYKTLQENGLKKAGNSDINSQTQKVLKLYKTISKN